VKVLLILSDPPCGAERSYDALRLAHALAKREPAAEITVFLMADAVALAKKGQKAPEGYYNVQRLLKSFAHGGHRLLLCASCMDARGLADAEVIDDARRSSMDELAAITLEADKALVF